MECEYHIPVLADEVLRYLAPHPGDVFVDGTVGGGGHSKLIAPYLAPDGVLVAVDQDPEALVAAGQALSDVGVRVAPVHANFRDMAQRIHDLSIGPVQSILLDIGVSSHQLDAAQRGFSFRAEAPLDMRMNTTVGETAADLLATRSMEELTRIFYEYGEERWGKRIAQRIVQIRQTRPLRTTAELADLVAGAIPKGAQPRDIHPATRVFQAVRIAVNDELGALQQALDSSMSLLAIGGRIAVISYHSLEDRIVKQTFIKLSGRCACPPGLPICQCGARKTCEVVTRKPVTPTEDEIRANPRARSAKLRVAQRVA